jgi:hypothetical protein
VEISEEMYYSEIDGVYHVLPGCPTGRQIPAEFRRRGMGGRLDMCPACEARVEANWNRATDYRVLSWLRRDVWDSEARREDRLRPEFSD